MKLLKKTTNNTTISQAFTVGDQVNWSTSSFDGRATEVIKHTGTVVKVNKKTVDVETAAGVTYRLDAFIKISTGEWTLA